MQDVLGEAEGLLAVLVDDRGQVGETVMGSEHRSFPDGALIALRIAHEDIHMTRRAVEASGKGGSDTE